MDIEIPTYTLNDGNSLPAIALGTYKLRGAQGVDAIVSGIRAGYRLLDSAFNYDNEGALGEAVRRAGVPREELRLTSKLPGRYQEHDLAVAAVRESLYRAGLDYWDLYLIHWPLPRVDRYVEAFQALVESQKEGLIRSVGVSNFLPEHLRRVIDEVGVVPAVNQIQLLPTFPQTDRLRLHEELGIRTESWSPLGRGNAVASDPVVVSVAAAHGVTPVQAILRWHTQLGTIPLPKSSHPQRQRENLDVFGFELSEDEMAAITALGRPDGRALDLDPAVHEEF
ncbi:MAG: aldo/keto reductase [Actinomyces sp.]|jgi:diketogulonate reductase-like aldo/keto reductase|uniref:Aldo/keto reductase n=1 Tax=Schaalia naturae TaxID=635203 RepID=A0ABW2SHX1_9ACTO|nr:aldo/keto reductase [Actinomyces sp.]MCI1642385.1 aldo/keto reductase [Actinomyces sp.]MCI1662957.1 aldo/keto reductase [Actinomyces sp.]MCI1691551.1 aldo/keto reductase [Actinomyces sp.]MCI1787155.1 aldo/keto reductase [Actinomyces sp.]MCI1829549.1 aldo/keto reductase [Actinomyces sp.]